MNVSLVQPDMLGSDIEPPHSLASLAAYLDREGHQVRLIDLQIESTFRQWPEILSSHPVDLVGFTATTPQVGRAHELAREARALKPNVPIIVGGVHPTILPAETLRDHPAFDMCVVGEGEETLLELVNRLARHEPLAHESVPGIAYRSGGDIVVTPRRDRIKNLDSLPDHHDYYDFDYYLNHNTLGFMEKTASLIISRGCPYNCQFCATRNFWGNRYVLKSVDAALEEVRHVLALGARGIRFRDSTFIINKKWIRAFCDRILAEKLTFRWAINARVDMQDYELLKHMRAAGLRSVALGVESGSQRILDFYGKGTTTEQVESAFAMYRKLRIGTAAYWMLGVLPETREDMDRTYKLAMQVKADQNYVFIFMPLPGAELYRYYLDHGFKPDFDHISWDEPTGTSEAGYSADELVAIRHRWYDDFNRQPRVLVRGLKSVSSIRSLDDLKDFRTKVARRIPFLHPN